jgi:hypothetical protein
MMFRQNLLKRHAQQHATEDAPGGDETNRSSHHL